MNITTASEHLRDILDVSDERYSPAVRLAHLNQAIAHLGSTYEMSFNEGTSQYLLEAGSEFIPMGSLQDISGESIQCEVIERLYYVTDYTVVGINANQYIPNTEWIKVRTYPDYASLLDDQSLDESVGIFGYAQRGPLTYVLNPPTEDVLLKILYTGQHQETTTENSWLRKAPWPVIYYAAQIACVYLEDEERVPVYQSLLETAITTVNLADSMRGDGPLESTEA